MELVDGIDYTSKSVVSKNILRLSGLTTLRARLRNVAQVRLDTRLAIRVERDTIAQRDRFAHDIGGAKLAHEPALHEAQGLYGRPEVTQAFSVAQGHRVVSSCNTLRLNGPIYKYVKYQLSHVLYSY